MLGRPWGGGRFGTADGQPVGEVWVTGDEAALPDGRTLGATGLAAMVPLVKLLDVHGRLSVQVHPDDAAAVELGGPGAVGKHECWVVLEAHGGATVALGLAPERSIGDLFSGDAGRIDAALRRWTVSPGTILDIAPGTVHAPGGGLLLYEIQQRSDLTFRIWDWGRPRPLHLREAQRCLRADAIPRVGVIPTDLGPVVVSAPGTPFSLAAIHLADRAARAAVPVETFAVVTVTRGEPTIAAASDDHASDPQSGVEEIALEAGSHWLLPAGRWFMRGIGDALVAAHPGTRPPAA